ncbi:hypothetical protein [Streptomyces bicolor]|uniref:hypothetical protein n=1 Tax=Streptomyces bicolor TaxID=66874 RepID=UPI0004E12045|nr:hypothetical protein [Streptomyces bicolor]
MTTALPATATPATDRPPRGARGLTWTVLRLHRSALIFWCLAVAAATGVLIWMYAIGDEARRGVGGCAEPVAVDGLPSCRAMEAVTADDTYRTFIALIAGALSYAIFAVAAWAGGALIGRELESGTAKLAWTQSVTPARWLAAKLAVPAVLLTAGTGAVTLLGLWARGDDDPNLVGDWYYPDVFLSTGPTAVAYPLAGLALGALAGLLLRRALPAAGVGFGAALVLYNVLERYRWEFWPTVTRAEAGGFELPRSAWQLGWADSLTRATFHPHSHFWPLQYVETCLVLTVAAVATLAAFWLLRRRTT